jgi:hypothetical protein
MGIDQLWPWAFLQANNKQSALQMGAPKPPTEPLKPVFDYKTAKSVPAASFAVLARIVDHMKVCSFKFYVKRNVFQISEASSGATNLAAVR